MGNPVVHFDLNGTDGKQLAEFYGELFGWHVQEVPHANYWLIDTHAGTGINGGIMSQGEPFIGLYAEGPDIQALLDKAESLGAKTLLPVTEIPNMVTYAMFADPQGNRVGTVKGDETQQGGPSEGDGVSVSWFEILGPDPKALVQFYTQLFGWTEKKTDSASSGDIPVGFEYHEMETGSKKGIPGGGIGSSPDGRPHVTVYAAVDDIQKYLERAETLGGKTVVPVTTMAQTTFAQFADPQGLMFGLFQSQQP